MRLAIVSTIFHYPWGGPDKRWTALAEACRERGDEVLLAISSRTADHPRVHGLVGSGAKLFLRSNSSIYRGESGRWKRRIPLLRDSYVEHQLSRFQPDVVFILQGGTYDALNEHHLAAWLQQSGVPYVVSCSLNSRDTRLPTAEVDYLRGYFTNAAAVLFMSTENSCLAEEHLGVALPQARVIQNPLDFALPEGGSVPAPRGERPRLGYVGRISIEHKGLDLFLEAMARLDGARQPDFHLTGRLESPDRFHQIVNDLGLVDRVFVHPYGGRTELAAAYRDAELLVLTSRQEGCASVMLEAMMAGRPQLVTPVGGVSDWLTDEVDAFVAADVSSDAVEATLRRALAARARWPEMGRTASESFFARRDRHPLQTLMDVVDKAAASGSRAGVRRSLFERTA
jgi:glycosyltransferase involved in cell wall biosynthesis